MLFLPPDFLALPMKFLYLLTAVLTLASCEIFDKEETIPAFIAVNSATLSTELSQGANTHEIIDATVFADGEFVGTFEMPAIVPILKNGPTTITIGAGIKNNGLSQDRIIYPFYNFNQKTIDLQPNTVTPYSNDTTVNFTYYNGVSFEIEDFENVGTDLLPFADNTATYIQISEPPENVRNGQSLEVILTPENNTFNVITDWLLQDLPKGNNIYLEIDFKGDHPLEIGIVTLDPTQQIIFAVGLLPKSEWTKVYVDLTNEIASQINTNSFGVYLESRTTEIDGEKHLFIDNLKFVHP